MRCAACGAPVIAAEDEEGAPMLLDQHELTHGPDRYVARPNGLMAPAREDYDRPAYVNHETTCGAVRA